jgi:peroxin-7
MNKNTPPQKYISDFEAYNVRFSPFENTKIACVFSQYFGMVGNGRLSVFNSNNFGVIEEVLRFNTNDSLFDLSWSEANENQIATVGGDGSVRIFYFYF